MESARTPALTANVMLTVCGLKELHEHRASDVTHILSLLDPGHPEPADFAIVLPAARLTMRFHDIIEPVPGMVAPGPSDIERLLAFGRDLDDVGHLLVHCHLGISRSTAALLILMAQHGVAADETALFETLREIRPQAWPNSRMVALGDEALGLEGRLNAALRAHYRIQARRYEHLMPVLRSLGRGAEIPEDH